MKTKHLELTEKVPGVPDPKSFIFEYTSIGVPYVYHKHHSIHFKSVKLKKVYIKKTTDIKAYRRDVPAA